MEDIHEEFIDVVTQDSNISEQLSEGCSSDHIPLRDGNEIAEDPNFRPPHIEFDSIGEFCYESDALALKGNQDYKNLLEAIVVLEAQRSCAVNDLKRLETLRQQALSDPFGFVDRLRRKEDLQLPTPQKVHPVPAVDWGKYALDANLRDFERRQVDCIKRQAQQISRHNNKKAKSQVANVEPNATANQLWSPGEHSRLKKLLVEHPTEECENSRWEKIAKCLGSRSPLEVATRVHAFYATLVTEIGLKLGNLPNLEVLKKKWSKTQENPNEQNTAVKAKEVLGEISDDEDISSDLLDSPEYHELLLLKKALHEKIVEESGNSTQHARFKCCLCEMEPIVGNRWRCVNCKPPLSVDFCEDCRECSYETGHHSADHRLEKQVPSKEFLDRDYMHFKGGDYNYLDPNYMPAT